MGGEKFAATIGQLAGFWRQYTGRIVILGMCLIALFAAIYAQWHLYYDSRQAHEYYGPDAATLIRKSSSLELLYLIPATPETKAKRMPELNVLDRPHAMAKSLDITKAPGAIHVRSALLSDANYAWHAPDSGATASWKYAIQFRENKSTAIVAIAPASGQAALVGNDKPLSIAPIVQALEDFRQSAEAQAATRSAGAKANRAVREAKKPK